MTTENCENCGRKIGKLETHHVYKQAIVCPECYVKFVPPPRKPYVDTLKRVRVFCLLIGIVIWPLLLVWIGLVIYGVMDKARYQRTLNS